MPPFIQNTYKNEDLNFYYTLVVGGKKIFDKKAVPKQQASLWFDDTT